MKMSSFVLSLCFKSGCPVGNMFRVSGFMLMLGCAWLLGLSAQSVEGQTQIIYAQDFNVPGATPMSLGWASGFASSGASSETFTVTNTGIGGSGALATVLDIANGANLSAFTEFYSGTLSLPTNASVFNLSLSADVTCSQAGVPFQLQLNDEMGHYISFNGVTGEAGTYQAVGGTLCSADSIDPGFNYNSTGYAVDVVYNSSTNWSTGIATFTIDNVILKTALPLGTNANEDGYYFENFDEPGATPASSGWTSGFAYSGASDESFAITNASVGGSNALVTTVGITDGANLGAFAELFRSTLRLPPTSDPFGMSLSAEVKCSQAGAPISLALQDDANHYIRFDGVITNADVFQPIGGRLSTASYIDPAFDFGDAQYFKMDYTFRASSNLANISTTYTIDNVLLTMMLPYATNYFENFDEAGATPASLGWASGFAYSGATSETFTITNAGIGGTNGLVASVDITNGPALGAFAEYYSQTLTLPNIANTNTISLTAEVTGNQTGVPFALELGDNSTPEHYIVFDGTVTNAGTFQPVGGRLSTASSIDPVFNFASTNGYSVLLVFGGPGGTWANGVGTLTIDNVLLRTVPSVAVFPLAASKQNGQMILSWPSVVGEAYAVQVNNTLTNNANWFNLASPAAAAASTTTYTNKPSEPTVQFYRIQVQ